MTVLSEQETEQVNELANRLRLIRADSAGGDPEQRRDNLQEVIASNLKSVPPANRKKYLRELLNRFPVAGKTAVPTPSAPVTPPSSQPTQTAEELLESFLTSASKLPDDRRTEMSKRLYDKGFAWVDKAALEVEISDELRQRFGLVPGQRPRLTRVVELAAWLVDLSCRLDQTTFNFWGELSRNNPQSKRHQDFRASVSRFVAGENEIIEGHLSAFSTLVGALLVALQKGPKEFESFYAQRFSPQAIEEIIAAEGVGIMQNRKERCWVKYKELAKDFAAPGVIDKQIKDSYVKIVEATLRSGR